MKTIQMIDLIDFYDYDELEKLEERRSMRWLKLYTKARKGDKKAIEDIRKHEKEDLEIKRRARAAGYYWI